MLPVTAHPEFGLRYLCGVWSYQLKVESMKRLLVVYQIASEVTTLRHYTNLFIVIIIIIQDMDCLCDRAYGHDPWIDGF